MTQYEKIKAMSTEEMAEFIYKISHIDDCEECIAYGSCSMKFGVSCKKLMAKWLESEVEEDG